MTDRRSRFVLEVLFLAGLATALALARLDALEIIGGMLVGWVVVAALEWAAWRGEPHYASGQPPRFYVPSADLPPPQPLEQVAAGYPDASREEAPTWIASAALRAEMLGEWPVAAPVPHDVEAEEEVVEFVAAGDPDADPWTVAELPAAPLEPEPEPEEVPGRDVPGTEVEPTVEEVEPTVGEAAQPTVEEVEPTVEEVEPTVEEVEPPVEEVEPTAEEHVPGTSVPGTSGVALGPAVARYSLDPLGDPEPRRRFSRGRTPAATVEVPARPEGRRPLPRRRDDA